MSLFERPVRRIPSFHQLRLLPALGESQLESTQEIPPTPVLVQPPLCHPPYRLQCLVETAVQKLSMAVTDPLPLQVSRLLRALSDDPQRRRARWMNHFNLQQQAALFSKDVLRQVRDVNPEELIVDAYRDTEACHLPDATLGVCGYCVAGTYGSDGGSLERVGGILTLS